MSSEVMSSALALRKKAAELLEKGHLLRAAQLYARAAEAARPLDPGADNCVTLNMLLYQACVLFSYFTHVANNAAVAAGQAAVNPGEFAACRAEIITLLSTVASALERRREAGTLLEGKCTASEEAWLAAILQVANCPGAVIPYEQTLLIGYITFITAAKLALDLLVNTLWFAEECSATQIESFTQFVICAMDLIKLPRRLATAIIIPKEATFAITLSKNVPLLASRGLDPRLAQLLTDAWLRLQRSGVLQQRCLLDERMLLKFGASNEEHVGVINSAMSAPGLRSCCLASCGAREAHPQHFKACAACRTVVYCCREHQVADWSAHKAACKAARKAAAPDKGAGAAPDARA